MATAWVGVCSGLTFIPISSCNSVIAASSRSHGRYRTSALYWSVWSHCIDLWSCSVCCILCSNWAVDQGKADSRLMHKHVFRPYYIIIKLWACLRREKLQCVGETGAICYKFFWCSISQHLKNGSGSRCAQLNSTTCVLLVPVHYLPVPSALIARVSVIFLPFVFLQKNEKCKFFSVTSDPDSGVTCYTHRGYLLHR